MPCHTAMLKKLVTVSPDQSVEKVIHALEENRISVAPVVDKEGVLQGVFSMQGLLKGLIPVSVSLDNISQTDLKFNAAPGIAKRLVQAKQIPVAEFMDRKTITVKPEAPLWEAVALLTKHGGTLTVVDDKNKFLGMITYASLVEALEELTEEGA